MPELNIDAAIGAALALGLYGLCTVFIAYVVLKVVAYFIGRSDT